MMNPNKLSSARTYSMPGGVTASFGIYRMDSTILENNAVDKAAGCVPNREPTRTQTIDSLEQPRIP